MMQQLDDEGRARTIACLKKLPDHLVGLKNIIIVSQATSLVTQVYMHPAQAFLKNIIISFAQFSSQHVQLMKHQLHFKWTCPKRCRRYVIFQLAALVQTLDKVDVVVKDKDGCSYVEEA